MSINDIELKWLINTEGTPSTQYNKAWYEWLGTEGYTGAYNDRWYAYLADLGLSGTLNDMMKQAFCTAVFNGDVSWILSTSFWDDAGAWIDADIWID